jgi:hypothetical protein
MAATPSALQLRLLQTVVDVASEKNSTLVMPFPVEMLRFFDQMSTPTSDAESINRSVEGDAAAPVTSPESNGVDAAA